ncbi:MULTISPECIES: hypothetical protein [unclassified Oleiphilus]|uniref:hypothetical protein n=1 Tax=unclassified Oleiphilus TaxID=2631174 RepID=UPI0007C2CD9F|nr:MULTISPECIES: hypothetical protein [unclassified Oleiphilus]KZY41219.1 hypothetical protein A3732_18570 [Oleiphilus sp. HI0050]KZZ35201.1 hypothetical protein A3757_02790 [Oleiphilus sp. HI0117]KZZ57454.1 hypothetical protein A3761_00550 [Oleiphilus sp. HI0123]
MFPVNKKLMRRLDREGAFKSKSVKNTNENIDIDVVGIIWTLLRESPFLFIGLGALSVLKNNTDINFTIVLVSSILLGVCSRFIMSALVIKADASSNISYRIILTVLLGGMPFLMLYLLFSTIFSVNSMIGNFVVIGVTLFLSAIIGSSIFDELS